MRRRRRVGRRGSRRKARWGGSWRGGGGGEGGGGTRKWQGTVVVGPGRQTSYCDLDGNSGEGAGAMRGRWSWVTPGQGDGRAVRGGAGLKVAFLLVVRGVARAQGNMT